MPIQKKIETSLLTEPPPPAEIKKPPALPPRKELKIPLNKTAETKKKEAEWWSNVYANAPVQKIEKKMTIRTPSKMSRCHAG